MAPAPSWVLTYLSDMSLLATRPAPQLAPLAEFESRSQYWEYILNEQDKADRAKHRTSTIIGWVFIGCVCAIPLTIAYLIYIRVVH